MAFVNGEISINFQFVDDDLAQASTSVKLPSGTTYANAIAYANGYVSLIQAVSDCALPSYTVTQRVYDNAYPTAATGSDVEDKGVLTIRKVGGGISTLSWPGILESLLVNTITPSSTYIDLAAPAIAALVAALLNGISGVQPADNRGADFLSVKEAYKQQRGSLPSREYRG